MVSGEKRMKPCAGCPNPTGCLVKAMHYKESNNMAKTPTVELMADGTIKCAKGLEMSECGYKPGAKTCGKCGAPALAIKSEYDELEGDGWVSADDEKGMMPMAPKKPMPMAAMGVDDAMDDEDDTDEYDEEKEAEEDMASMSPSKKKRMMDFMEQEKMYDEEEKGMGGDGEMSTDALMKKKKRMMAFLEEEKKYGAVEDDMPSDMDEEDQKMYDEIEKMMNRRKMARAKRMESMGVKSLDYDEQAFVCAIERKVYAGGSDICAQCPGGCEPHGDLPSLLEVEGIAEDMFAGKVLDSGYADETDIFVVDVQRKDGKPIEAYFDGTSGECMGWHLLNEELIGEVASVPGEKVISFGEAATIATKSIEGEVVSVDADMFEGYDAYAVEIEGKDGKSYDVFVGIDGEVLGYDEYDAEEASDIDAEVADLALKRAYSDDQREKMSRSGEAMDDGSYPIADETDLKNAIMAYGRAKDKEKAMAHIKKRAIALGKEDMIPEEWASEGKSLDGEEAKSFLSDLMEFELLTIETGIDSEESK